jgi:hypothetical protein
MCKTMEIQAKDQNMTTSYHKTQGRNFFSKKQHVGVPNMSVLPPSCPWNATQSFLSSLPLAHAHQPYPSAMEIQAEGQKMHTCMHTHACMTAQMHDGIKVCMHERTDFFTLKTKKF